MSEKPSHAERVIHLIRVLNTTDGMTREQIFTLVPGYPHGRAGDRMFERDLLLLESLNFQIERDNHLDHRHLYHITHAENFFRRKKTKIREA